MKTEFNQWFRSKKFRNFSAGEFTSYFELTRRGVKNSYPPKRMWEKIVPSLRIVDDLRDHFGKPCVILSSYRSPAYNGAINGAASRSFHMQFCALDIAVAGVTPRQVRDLLLQWRRAGKFVGGIGIYNSFVHIDTRGYNAAWGRG